MEKKSNLNLEVSNSFLDNVDDIFKALYGSVEDESDGVKYFDYYSYEVDNMLQEFTFYVSSMKMVDSIPTIEEIANILVYLEYVNIGNNHLVRKNINKKELQTIAKKIKECLFNKENEEKGNN